MGEWANRRGGEKEFRILYHWSVGKEKNLILWPRRPLGVLRYRDGYYIPPLSKKLLYFRNREYFLKRFGGEFLRNTLQVIIEGECFQILI